MSQISNYTEGASYLGEATLLNCYKILGHVADQNYLAIIEVVSSIVHGNENRTGKPGVHLPCSNCPLIIQRWQCWQ